MSALSGYVSDDLYELTRALNSRGHDTDGGFLGGEFGYGCEYENDIFEMHQFWWGDCECGFEQREARWLSDVPHLDDCYQTAVATVDWKDCDRLAADWNLPKYGSAVHCTCGQGEAYAEWRKVEDHAVSCPIVRPNFRHKSSGVEVRWYKYLGRGMEVEHLGSREQWRRVIAECEESLNA